MKFNFISLVFIFTIVLSQEIDSPEAVTKVATCAANWLKIESGVRGIGMGGLQMVMPGQLILLLLMRLMMSQMMI